jgi:hypothetical protein
MVKAGDASPKSPKVLKKAMSAYFIFNNENRDKVKSEQGLVKIGDVAKALSAVWGGMSDKEKAPYNKKAEADKARFEKQKAAGWVPKARKSKKDKEGKKKKAKDPNMPKRPQSAYFLWLNANRAKIIAEHKLDAGKVAEVAKKAGEIWGTMTDAQKAPFTAKAEKDKARYAQEMAARGA